MKLANEQLNIIEKRINYLPKCLLLVEDEMITAMAQAKTLEARGYHVITASSGIEAIEIVRSDPDEIDLILMDIDLGSGMDGTEAAREILRDHDIPVIFVSSHTEKEIVEKTERITSYGYVVKNTGVTVLVASIKMAFKLHDAHRVLKLKDRHISKSEKNYRTTFETTGTAIVVFNEDSVIIHANAKFAQLAGYTVREIVRKKKWIDFVVRDDLKRMLSLHRLRSENNETAPKEYEFKLINKSGDIRDILMTIDVIPGTTNRVASLMDVTESKRMEYMLRQKEKQYQRYFNNPVLGIFQANPRGDISSANRALACMLGYDSIDDFMIRTGGNVSRLYANPIVHPEITDKILGSESLTEFECEFLQKNGNTTICQLYAWPVFDADGNVMQMEGFVHDITSQKQAEQQLKATLQQMEDIIEFLPDPCFVIDQDRKVVFWNKAIEQLTGTKKEEVIGRDDFAYADPFYREREPILIDLVYSSSSQVEEKYNHVRRIGDIIYAERYFPQLNQGVGGYLWGAAAPLFNSNGQRIGAIEVIRDITEHKYEEQVLEKSLEEKNVLMRELKHRVKNTLNIVASLLSLGTTELNDDRAKKVFNDAVSRIHSISRIYEQLNTTDNPQDVALDTYIKDMTVSLIDTYTVAKKRINLIMRLDEIDLDVKRAVPLGLIVNESVTNTLKYAHPDGSNGELNVVLSKNGELITLIIYDDGVGLPDSVRNGNSRRMGLQLIELLAKQIRGELVIDSGKGTYIRVTFRK